MRRDCKIWCHSLIRTDYQYFLAQSTSRLTHLCHLCTYFRNSTANRNWTLAVITIHEWPFPLPQRPPNCHFNSPNNRVQCPLVASETTTTPWVWRAQCGAAPPCTSITPHLFGLLKHAWKVADSTVLKKWKWLFMNGHGTWAWFIRWWNFWTHARMGQMHQWPRNYNEK